MFWKALAAICELVGGVLSLIVAQRRRGSRGPARIQTDVYFPLKFRQQNEVDKRKMEALFESTINIAVRPAKFEFSPGHTHLVGLAASHLRGVAQPPDPREHLSSTTQPGPAAIANRNPCNLTIAATRLRPSPKPGVCRLLSER